jgi:hypothetical protein
MTTADGSGDPDDSGANDAGDTSDDGKTGDTAGDSDLPPGLGLDADADLGGDGGDFPDDEERRAFLRAIAEEVRGDSSESRQLAAILYRVSDLYDPDEDTSPQEIYLNVRNIMQVKARGGLRRE